MAHIHWQTAAMEAPVLDKAEGEGSHPGLSSNCHTCFMACTHPHSHRGTKDQNRLLRVTMVKFLSVCTSVECLLISFVHFLNFLCKMLLTYSVKPF